MESCMCCCCRNLKASSLSPTHQITDVSLHSAVCKLCAGPCQYFQCGKYARKIVAVQQNRTFLFLQRWNCIMLKQWCFALVFRVCPSTAQLHSRLVHFCTFAMRRLFTVKVMTRQQKDMRDHLRLACASVLHIWTQAGS